MPRGWITFVTFSFGSFSAFFAATLVYDHFIRYRLKMRARVNEFSYGSSADPALSLFKDLQRLHVSEAFKWKEQLLQIVEQSGVECSLATLGLASLGTGLILAAAGLWRAWWLAAILFPLGAPVPLLALFWRRQVRQRKLSQQLPEAFAMISRAVRAGQTLPAALQIIADDFEPPVSTEFALCYQQQNLGIARETALRKLASRSGIMELQIFVVAILVQAKSGGNLVELLDNLALMIRKRLKLKDRVRALTGEGRMQALVLILLPCVALFGIVYLAPTYAKELLDRPWLLAGTATAQAIGTFWIRKIVNFEY